MLARHFHAALTNLVQNRGYLALRLVALAGGLMAGSCIYLMRYALDYGGWLPDAQGIFPSTGSNVPHSWFIAAVVLHVDIALWHCLAMSGIIFLAGVVILTGRAARQPPGERPSIVHYL